MEGRPSRRRAAPRPPGGPAVLATLVLALLAVAALALLVRGDAPDGLERVAAYATGEETDPLSYGELPETVLGERAALGNSHVLYALSPEGAPASAERTGAWRDMVEEAVEGTELDAEMLEAMIFLESAGRPDVSAGPTPEAATGLTQILPSTATDLLDMRVDLEASVRLSERLIRAQAAGASERAEELAERRRQVDERFDPEAALEGMVRYLEIAFGRFGREDLAVVSYHMGMGNLENVIRAHTEDDSAPIAELVADEELSYARLFFDSSPRENEEAWSILTELGDDSATYLWRVLASREVMRLWRESPSELARVDALMTAKATAEELFHPPGETRVYEDADEVALAMARGELRAVPDDPDAYGFTIGPQLGERAAELGAPRGVYRSLAPETLATLVYVGSLVREMSGAEEPLILTSATRDRRYQESLRGDNPEATDGYSLHTTGHSFDILREYESSAQAAAFQFALDRLRSLAVIDYAREPRAIHVTTGPGARDLLP